MKFISWKEFGARMGLSRSTMKNLIKDDPLFPKKYPISSMRVGFLESEVDSYMKADKGDAWIAMLREEAA